MNHMSVVFLGVYSRRQSSGSTPQSDPISSPGFFVLHISCIFAFHAPTTLAAFMQRPLISQL
jgi:hypothetical protein